MIEALKKILKDSGLVSAIHTDFSENELGDIAILSSGETIIKKFVTGECEKEANFLLLMCLDASTDDARVCNLIRISAICDYLSSVSMYKTSNLIIKSIRANNAMPMEVAAGMHGGYIYQAQIKVNYREV